MSAAGDRLRRLADRADNEGGRAAAQAMGKAAADAIQRNLIRRSHSRGTPTPSPPGQPPAKISGDLRDSVRPELPRMQGGGVWVSVVGPHGVVYAAIQQYGGRAGRHHASDLPPRPYMDTTPDRSAISRAGEDAFHRVMRG